MEPADRRKIEPSRPERSRRRRARAEAASGVDLTGFFGRWVYARDPALGEEGAGLVGALATKEVEVTVAAEGDRHEAGPVRTGP